MLLEQDSLPARSSEACQRPSCLPDLPSLSNSIDSAHSELADDSLQRGVEKIGQKGQHLTPDKFHELVTRFGQEEPKYALWHCRAEERRDISTSMRNTHETVSHANGPVAKEVADGVIHTAESKSEVCTSCKSHPPSIENVQSSLRRASSVVHGFNPSCVYVKKDIDALNEIVSSSSAEICHTQNKSMFFIESSPSESDTDGVCTSVRSKKRNKCKSSQARGKQHSSPPKQTQPKQHASFRQIVDEGSEYESSPFDTDEESNDEPAPDKDESAILSDDDDNNDDVSDDEDEVYDAGDDEDEWASVCSESQANSPQSANVFDKMHGKAERPGLVSRKSILSTLLTNPMTRLKNAHSRSSPTIAQSRRASPSNSPAGRPKPHNMALPVLDNAVPTNIRGSVSPRSTRRNMLATELSESLRRHLLWERKQKSAGDVAAIDQAVLKRRHTGYDLNKMQVYPLGDSIGDPSQAVSDNEFGYNGAGW